VVAVPCTSPTAPPPPPAPNFYCVACTRIVPPRTTAFGCVAVDPAQVNTVPGYFCRVVSGPHADAVACAAAGCSNSPAGCDGACSYRCTNPGGCGPGVSMTLAANSCLPLGGGGGTCSCPPAYTVQPGQYYANGALTTTPCLFVGSGGGS